MKNLGAKLKAAREAKELSLRDVADATRLRIYVIENMEKGSFDYDLPDIYKRGFLRIYAAFLKFNVDDIMREYNTAMAMRNPDGATRTVFVPSEEEIPQITNFDEPQDSVSSDIDMTSKYIKIGGIAVLAILAIIIIVMIFSSSKSDTAVEENGVKIENVEVSDKDVNDSSIPVVSDIAEPSKLVIKASGDTYVTVRKLADSKSVLFTGKLQNGMSKEFVIEEPLFVNVTDGSKITLVRNSKVIYDKTNKGISRFNVSPR